MLVHTKAAVSLSVSPNFPALPVIYLEVSLPRSPNFHIFAENLSLRMQLCKPLKGAERGIQRKLLLQKTGNRHLRITVHPRSHYHHAGMTPLVCQRSYIRGLL